MTTYALIDNTGLVVNTIVCVDLSQYTIPQGLTAEDVGTTGAGIGWTYANGTFTAPVLPTITPTKAQLAAEAIANNVVIVSSATFALNGTYSCNEASQAKLNAVTTFLMLNNAFPAGLTEMPWADVSGNSHMFGISDFKNFATAIANYVALVDLYANGAISTLPSNQITIA